MDRFKGKGMIFEGSDKKYPDVKLPNWMLEQEELDKELDS